MTDDQDADRTDAIETDELTPVGPGWMGSTFDPNVIDFGHYAGRTIEEIAESDPSYLYWLARHPSGARYRAKVAEVLGARQAPPEY